MKLFAAITLMCLVHCSSLLAQQRDADIKLRLAQSFERANDWERAVKIYEELLTSDSTNPVIFESLRRGYLQLKRHDDAIRLIESHLRLRPNDVGLLAQLGIVSARVGDERRAVDTWERAIATNPRNINSYYAVAGAAMESRLLDQAIRFYQRGRKELGNPLLFVPELAYTYALTMNYAEATREYVKLVKQSPGQLSFVQSRMTAFTLRPEGRRTALTVLEEELRSLPDNLPLHQLFAWLLMEGREFDKAYDVYLHIDEKTKAGGRELYTFSERALREKAYATAARAFRTIIDRYPKFDRMAAARYGYARTLQESLSAQDSTLPLLLSPPPGAGLARTSLDMSANRPSENRSQYSTVMSAFSDVARDYSGTDLAAQAYLQIARTQLDLFFDIDAAVTTLAKIRNEYTRFPLRIAEATLLLGDALLTKGDLTGALGPYRMITSAQGIPTELTDQAEIRLAHVEYYRGNSTEAIRLLGDLTSNPRSDVANDALDLLVFLQENSGQSAGLNEYSRASFLVLQRRLPEAAAVLENIVKQHGTSELADETFLLLGDVYVAMERYSDGIGAYRRLMQQFPESITLDRAFMRAGHVYEARMNDKPDALAAYQSLLEKFPNSVYCGEARKRIRQLRGDNL